MWRGIGLNIQRSMISLFIIVSVLADATLEMRVRADVRARGGGATLSHG